MYGDYYAHCHQYYPSLYPVPPPSLSAPSVSVTSNSGGSIAVGSVAVTPPLPESSVSYIYLAIA